MAVASPAPYQPTLRVGAWEGPAWLRSAADFIDLTERLSDLSSVDLVVVGGRGGPGALGDWLGWEARQPLVLWEPTDLDAWRPHLTDDDVVVGAGGRDTGPATPVVPFPVVDPRTSSMTTVAGSAGVEPSEDTVRAALARQPLVWEGEEVPAGLQGIVRRPSSDPARAGLLARLEARRRFNPGVALKRITSPTRIDLPPFEPTVGVLLVTRRPDRLPVALEGISRIHYPHVKVVVGLHGAGDIGDATRLAASLGLEDRALLIRFDERWPLGRCLNEATSRVAAEVLAKFDDDDRYGPWYLDEAVDELASTGAELVGKLTQFVHLVHNDQLLLFQSGHENADVGYVNGPTFVMPRRSWEAVRFPHRRARVDSIFLRGLRVNGGRIRSTSRYEFVLGRYGQGHTWEASDEYFHGRSEVIGSGTHLSAVWLDN
jgi:hypothetical protein